jgi:hypothetical protein
MDRMEFRLVVLDGIISSFTWRFCRKQRISWEIALQGFKQGLFNIGVPSETNVVNNIEQL